MNKRLVSSVVSLSLSLAACAADPSDEAVAEGDAELRAVSAAELAGTIACGETKHVHHDASTTYRALSFTAKKGQSVDVWVRAPHADAKAWLTTPKGSALASSDDAEGSRDAHLVYSVKTAGEERIVFRDKNFEDGDFDVTLSCPGNDPPPPVPPAPPAVDDPFDPASCGGDALTSAEAIARIGAGNESVKLGGTKPLLARTRSCNAVTGCGPWSAPSPAVRSVYMAGGGDNWRAGRSFDMTFALFVSGASIRGSVEDTSNACVKCAPTGGPQAALGSPNLLTNTVYFYYPLWVHTSSGFQTENHFDSWQPGSRANGALRIHKNCARLSMLSDDMTAEYAVLFRY